LLALRASGAFSCGKVGELVGFRSAVGALPFRDFCERVGIPTASKPLNGIQKDYERSYEITRDLSQPLDASAGNHPRLLRVLLRDRLGVGMPLLSEREPPNSTRAARNLVVARTAIHFCREAMGAPAIKWHRTPCSDGITELHSCRPTRD